MDFHGIVMYQKAYRERDLLVKFFYGRGWKTDVFLFVALKNVVSK